MKLRLSKALMVAVLAAITGVANAAMTTPTAGVEGHIWTWDGNNWTKDDGTVSSPTRDADTGAFVIFEADKKSQNPGFGETSDGGGVWVKDNVNVSEISLGTWGGTIQINAGAYLDANASQLKSEVVNDTTANVWVEGVLNLRGFNKFDGAANQKWHIGKDGMIVLPDTTSSLNKISKQWHIELVHQIIDQEEIEGIVNRTRKEITQTRTYLQTQEDLSSSLDSLTVLDVNGNVLEKDVDYSIQNSQSSLGISYKLIGYENVDLTWKGVDGSKWEHAGAAWIDANGEVTSFINGDNVVFDILSGDVTNTVLLSGNLTVGSMEVKDNYTFVTKENVTLRAGSIAVSDNKTLTKSGDASLVVQGSINGNVAVTGGTLEVSGANAINGSKLDITNGKVVATLTGDGKSVIAHDTQVNIGIGGTLELNGHDMLGWGRDTAPSFILGSTDVTKTAKLIINDNQYNTFAAVVTMNGNSEISGTKFNTLFQHKDGVNNTALTVNGKNNIIKVDEIQLRKSASGVTIKSWDIDVTASSDLTITSKLSNETYGSSDITKYGDGKLILTNSASDFNSTLNVNAGVVQLKESASLKDASVVVSASGTIELGTGSVKNLTLSDNSSLVLNAYGEKAAFVIGSLSLGVNLTLDTTTMQRIVGLQKDESLIIFQSVTDLVLGGDESQLATADSVTGTIGVDAAAYFKGLEVNTYYLNLVGGNVSITKQIPEPTTVTLSLLALAGLAARRRRK